MDLRHVAFLGGGGSMGWKEQVNQWFEVMILRSGIQNFTKE